MLLTLRDESPGGRPTGQVTVEVPTTITLRDLVRARVREEVAKYNAAPRDRFTGLVTPKGATEGAAGSSNVPPGRTIDWEAQAEVALSAFEKNAFFVLVGDRQVGSLDEVLDLSEASEVSFVRLVALVGG